MNPNNLNFLWITGMLNDPQNYIPSSSSATLNANLPTYNPYASPDQQILFQQWQLQQQMLHTIISQQQSGNSQQPSHEIQEKENETFPTPPSKKPGSRGKRIKKMVTRNVDLEPEPKTQAEVVKVRNFLSQDEELLLAEYFIQISEDLKIGSDQKNDIFSYKILEVYNDQAGKRGFPICTKNLLTRKWSPMNREEPELFGDDALPRPPGLHMIAKSQRSLNSTASSGSNPTMFQEMIQQQYELDRKE
nr:hypothetical protein [Tanacetum cinerariifolium]